MSEVPSELKYTSDHEWLRMEEDGSVVVGVTDHAQAALGELVFVETPEPGTDVSQGDACAVVESVKAASDVYAPINGEILETNETLATAPEQVNQDPYGDGWLFRMRPADPQDLEELLDADAYQSLLDDLD
jgi:glycine cleavage system H protein